MRSTVIISDSLTFLAASWIYFKVGQIENLLCHLIVVAYPGLILIDHGHFQYNCVSLGLVIFSVSALRKDYDILSCVMFCLSLSFKQMSLYYALPYFFYFLGKCLKEAYYKSQISGLKSLIKISLSVILTIGIVCSPFLFDSNNIIHILNRIFPLDRGIFEDKVSNIWCVLNLFYKFKIKMSNSAMAAMCSAVTLVAVLPSSVNILLNPRKDMFLLSLINSSLAFFLFSFQVHEKSILLVALPVMFYFKHDPLHCFWFLLISTFSMLPLFKKDGLVIPFLILSVFYIIVFVSFDQFSHLESAKHMKLGHLMFSFVGCCILTFCILFVNPPTKYPDIFPLLISVYSACHFVGFFVYFNYKQIAFRFKI
ncbi:hypothetical protein AAG570_012652 [Ranatra chinensis]|uniref:Alpha-1,3-glucosyltransferase n=1 Tax=Ranatra chinensis TaxID=642074 RepID=A0ABD0YEH9_9HEMI